MVFRRQLFADNEFIQFQSRGFMMVLKFKFSMVFNKWQNGFNWFKMSAIQIWLNKATAGRLIFSVGFIIILN